MKYLFNINCLRVFSLHFLITFLWLGVFYSNYSLSKDNRYQSASQSYRVLGDIHGNFLYGLQLLYATGAFEFDEQIKQEIDISRGKNIRFNLNLKDIGFIQINSLIEKLKKSINLYLKGKKKFNFYQHVLSLSLPIRWKQDQQRITVVQLGDIFDRGIYDIEMFFLLHILKIKAQEVANKRLVMVIGNHELINLDDSIIDANTKGHEEPVKMQMRERYLSSKGRNVYQSSRLFKNKITKMLLEEALQPGGKIAKLFAENKPIEILDGILFTHGGLSQEFINLDLGGEFLKNYQWYINLFSQFMRFNKLPNKLPSWLVEFYGKKRRDVVKKILKYNIIFDEPYEAEDSILIRPGNIGPTWYRGYNGGIEDHSKINLSEEKEKKCKKVCDKLIKTMSHIQQENIDSGRQRQDIKWMVVGHSRVSHIKSFCQEKIFYTETGGWEMTNRNPQILKMDISTHPGSLKMTTSVLNFNQ